MKIDSKIFIKIFTIIGLLFVIILYIVGLLLDISVLSEKSEVIRTVGIIIFVIIFITMITYDKFPFIKEKLKKISE